MKEMGWSYQNMIDVPIPTFMMVSEELEKQAKKQEKAMKRKR